MFLRQMHFIIWLGPPIIQARHSMVCNHTADVYLQCILSGDLQFYGFSQWTHSVYGKFIRNLNGRNDGNTSTLLIQSCSYEDAGNYTCRAWNKNNHTNYWSNKTTILTINGKVNEQVVPFLFNKIFWKDVFINNNM